MIGVVATWILPSTLEDLLAIGLAGLAGYVALLNLPLRRAEAKSKLERVANNFIQVSTKHAVQAQHHKRLWHPIGVASLLVWRACIKATANPAFLGAVYLGGASWGHTLYTGS